MKTIIFGICTILCFQDFANAVLVEVEVTRSVKLSFDFASEDAIFYKRYFYPPTINSDKCNASYGNPYLYYSCLVTKTFKGTKESIESDREFCVLSGVDNINQESLSFDKNSFGFGYSIIENTYHDENGNFEMKAIKIEGKLAPWYKEQPYFEITCKFDDPEATVFDIEKATSGLINIIKI